MAMRFISLPGREDRVRERISPRHPGAMPLQMQGAGRSRGGFFWGWRAAPHRKTGLFPAWVSIAIISSNPYFLSRFLSLRVKPCRNSCGRMGRCFGGPKSWQKENFYCDLIVRRQKSLDCFARRRQCLSSSCLWGNSGKAFPQTRPLGENQRKKGAINAAVCLYHVYRRRKMRVPE